MPRIPVLVAVLALLIAPAADAICPHLNLRYSENPPALAWDNIDIATGYQVLESFDNTSARIFTVDSSPFLIRRRSSADVKIAYTVTAIMPLNILALGDSFEACRESTLVTLKADPAFRKLTGKAVVPIAGSGPGANGGRFKTSLKLTATAVGERGRVIFHPAGAVAGPNDPAVRYEFNDFEGQVLAFDDVVGSMGRSGVGSLDIVPAEGSTSIVPSIEARLYNDTSSGTFGTMAPALLPFDFLQAPTLTVAIPSSDAQFRVNVGLRTLTDTRGTALIYGTNGRLRDFRRLAWPADYTILAPMGQIIGTPVDAGETVSIVFDGAAIPFYTRTENRTNDPELFFPGRNKTTNVGFYVE